MDYLTYKNAKLPVRLSYYAIKQFESETGKSIDTLDSNITNLEVFLYHALVVGAKAEDKELTVKRDDMEFLLDECLTDFNTIMLNAFPAATGGTNKKK